ncbi:MAG: hypothetical protein NT166_29295 [Candidatus Aminicenantes bacterium]|nr:hypothetical protein [Candidatus Aminicenantes bacterium]
MIWKGNIIQPCSLNLAVFWAVPYLFDNIRIELYKGTVLKTVICASAPAGIGKYTWTIPANIPQGTKYKIKITSVDVGLNLSDASNDYFTIAGSSGTDGSL